MVQGQVGSSRYRVVFKGECLEGHDPTDVRRAFIRSLRLNERRAERMFSGRRIVLADDLERARAYRLVAKFSAIGAVLHAEASTPNRSAPSPRGWRLIKWVAVGALGVVIAVVVGVVLGTNLGGDVEHAVGNELESTAHSPVEALRSPPVLNPEHDAARSSTSQEVPLALRELSETVQRAYLQEYLPAREHKAFAIGASGSFGWHHGANDENAAREKALENCVNASVNGGGQCRIVDADGEWEE